MRDATRTRHEQGQGMLVEIQLVQVIVQAGALGIIVYLVLWLTRTKIPDDRKEREAERIERVELRKSEMQQREAIEAAHQQQQKDDRDTYLRELDEKRKEFLEFLAVARVEQRAEAEECRKERRELAKQAQSEREADRLARHELATMIQKVIGELHDTLPNRPRANNNNG